MGFQLFFVMNVINLNKARAQQWKTILNQELENGLKKEQKVKLRQWVAYIERVVPPKTAEYYQLVRMLASMNINNQVFPPFDKAPNDREHGGRYLENLGKKLQNLGIITECGEEEMDVMSVNELNLLQRVVDPKGAKDIARQQENLKKPFGGKTKTTIIKRTNTKIM